MHSDDRPKPRSAPPSRPLPHDPRVSAAIDAAHRFVNSDFMDDLVIALDDDRHDRPAAILEPFLLRVWQAGYRHAKETDTMTTQVTLIPVETIIQHAMGQEGDTYVFATEADPLDRDPGAFDCSELIEWACARAGVLPRMPDGAYYQWMHCRKFHLELSVATAQLTRGALLFAGDGIGKGRDAIAHVALSLGGGKTIEARGKKWGVGVFASEGRFQFGALMPGVSYPQLGLGAGELGATERLLVDGLLGPKTVAALQRALRRHGFRDLAVDGHFGHRTADALRLYLDVHESPPQAAMLGLGPEAEQALIRKLDFPPDTKFFLPTGSGPFNRAVITRLQERMNAGSF